MSIVRRANRNSGIADPLANVVRQPLTAIPAASGIGIRRQEFQNENFYFETRTRSSLVTRDCTTRATVITWPLDRKFCDGSESVERAKICGEDSRRRKYFVLVCRTDPAYRNFHWPQRICPRERGCSAGRSVKNESIITVIISGPGR